MNNKNLIRNIKILVVFFSICFFSIILYLTYFDLYVADKIIDKPSNRRIRMAENEVLRGNILDKNGDTIVYSKRNEKGNQKRIYNSGELYAHIVGYNSYVYGKSGVEGAYNDVLQGASFTHDILGSIFRRAKETISHDDKKGNDVYLTINNRVQKIAFDSLKDYRGAVVALNPKTGEVIAMVSKPSYDPQKIEEKFKEYSSDKDGTPFLNRATNGYYPPGSTFKIITAAAALQNLNGIKSERFHCTGKLNAGGYILRDYNGESHGGIDLEDAFRESCNYTFGQIGMKLGFTNLKNTSEKFMFNKTIPVDDEYDSLRIKPAGIKADTKEEKSFNAQNGIGQHNVTANPMTMALVSATIANNGIMMKPYVVSEVKDRYGVTISTANPKKLADVIDFNTADTIKNYMINVVKSGTGTNAKISGITVAGKTGTAEDQSKNQTHSWFVAFAPADNPQIAIAVIVENGGVGGKRAASIARDVIKEYLKVK